MMRIVRLLSPYLLPVALVALLITGGLITYSWTAHAQDAVVLPDSPGPETPTVTAAAAESMFYMPLTFNDHNPRRSPRIGFGTSSNPVTNAGDVRVLNAGWYVDWIVNSNPVRPGGMEYMPMVRVHQKLACGIGVTADREKCPYLNEYEYSPNASAITAFAQANPGSTWLLGNEMDRVDWPGGGRQDEMQPTLYPVFYKEVYDIIKAADPTAKVAIGGVIQATPLRLQYLTTIWDTYKQLYGSDMPVDVWNVHNFINAEFCQKEDIAGGKELICYGGAIPPGSNTLIGAYYGEDWRHIDRVTFDAQIRAMRQWMKDRGQQEKPLIITEYGVLYKKIGDCPQPLPGGGCGDPNWVDLTNPQVIQDFMLWTFDYFADTKDCAIGYVADDCRLVQRWAWFSLENVGWDFNLHGMLFDHNVKQLAPAGERFRQYTLSNYEKLQ